jgi:hypothetical protein
MKSTIVQFVDRRAATLAAAIVLALAATTAACAQEADDQSPARERAFEPLLGENAKELWVGYGKDAWPEGWELEDGVLHRTASGGDLRTVKDYRNFDLRWEWKVSPGGNSGVLYRVAQRDGPSYETGMEYQILDNSKHADGKNPLTSAAALYGLYAPPKDLTKPVGEWNESRIVVRGNRVRHFLNGEEVATAQIGDDDWNQRLAKSKFASWDGFAKAERGHIALQDHGDEVWYRNMRIRELRRGGGRGRGNRDGAARDEAAAPPSR